MSNNPMQRIADLEAQVAALTAENSNLRARPNGNGHLDAEKLIESVGLRIDRSGQLLREDFTGKLAGMIAPYIKDTLNDCAKVARQQDELEQKFAEHRKAVAGSAAQLEAAFVKMRKEAAKDWQTQRDQIQADFGRVDGFVKWFTAELQQSAQRNNGVVRSCNLAAERCKEAAEQVSAPAAQTIEHLNQIRAGGEASINNAARHLSNTYHNLRQPVMTRVTALLFATVFIHLFFAGFSAWGTRRILDTNWQAMTEHSEQQKQEMKALLDKTLEDAKQEQINKEIKVKMWDALIDGATPAQRQALIGKYRELVNEAEQKRLRDQMSVSYEQMGGKK